MHFCHVTTFYPPHSFGGDAIAVQRLCEALARRGHQVTVVSDSDAYFAMGGTDVDVPAPAGVQALRLRSGHALADKFLVHQTGRPVRQKRRIAKILNDPSIDLIHFHNVSLLGGPGVLRMGRAPKLYSAHEHWLVCPTHVLWRHQREPCQQRQCLRCQLRHHRPPQLWRAGSFLVREAAHIDVFLAMSEFSRDKHHEFGWPTPMEVLPPFVADAQIAGGVERHESGSGGRPYFLLPGRVEHFKGIDTAIAAFAGYEQADLLIAGDGTATASLRASTHEIANIRWLGKTMPDELRSLYRGAVATIAPARGYETFGLTLIESMAQGTPVIARNIGPFPEIIAASGGGLLFNDADELRSAISRLQGNSAERQALARDGLAATRAQWSESAVLGRYLQIVARTLQQHARDEVA